MSPRKRARRAAGRQTLQRFRAPGKPAACTKVALSYLAWGEAIHAFVDKVDLDDQDRARTKLISDILVDALLPTNGLVSNPAALKKLIDTGESSGQGLKTVFEDLVRNSGMPSKVNSKRFQLGKTRDDAWGGGVRAEVLSLSVKLR